MMSDPLIQRARELRRNQTLFEGAFWRLLRDRRLEGYKFRRQYPISPYIADFVCVSAKLVIELDGNSYDDRTGKDVARDEFLKLEGWKVLRVRNAELMRDGNSVVLTIMDRLQ